MKHSEVVCWFRQLKDFAKGMGLELREFHNNFQVEDPKMEFDIDDPMADYNTRNVIFQNDNIQRISGFLEGIKHAKDQAEIRAKKGRKKIKKKAKKKVAKKKAAKKARKKRRG